jgi:DNA-binding PadR family transcriptional regulator
MESEGKISSRWIHSTGKGPRRRNYEITPQGRDALYEEALNLVNRAKFIELFLSEFKRIF